MSAEKTSLHYAIEYGLSDEVIENLLASGSNPNEKVGGMTSGHWNYTPMHWASRRNKPGIAELLLHHGADVNAGNGINNTPLHIAIYHNNHAMAQWLLENGADPDCKNRSQRFFEGRDGANTPFHYAVYYSDAKMIKILLRNGASKDVKNQKGRTPMMLANYLEKPHLEILIDTFDPQTEASSPRLQSTDESESHDTDQGIEISFSSATTYFQNQQFEAAVECLELLLSSGTDTFSETDRKSALLLLGHAHRGAANFESAIRTYDELLLVDPENFELRFNKGLVMIELAKVGEILPYFADLASDHGVVETDNPFVKLQEIIDFDYLPPRVDFNLIACVLSERDSVSSIAGEPPVDAANDGAVDAAEDISAKESIPDEMERPAMHLGLLGEIHSGTELRKVNVEDVNHTGDTSPSLNPLIAMLIPAFDLRRRQLQIGTDSSESHSSDGGFSCTSSTDDDALTLPYA